MTQSLETVARTLFDQGYSFQIKGELEHAIDFYLRSISAFPTAEAHTYLGWVYSFQDRYEEAIEECFKAIEIDPEYANPYNDIGSYLVLLEKPERAIYWFKKALEAPRYESRVFPLYNLGRVYELFFEYPQALKFYRQALDEDTEYQPAYRAWVRLCALLN